MSNFLGQCVTTSCGLLESSSVVLTNNNKLLGVGDKNIGSTDATNVNLISDNKIRATLKANGNFDVRDLRTSELDILPNEQFKVVSGTATLSNYEATITTTAQTDEFKTSREFIPSNAVTIAPHEIIIKVDSLTSSSFQCGVIDSINTITLIPGGPFALIAGDLITLTLIDLGGTERVNLKINNVLKNSEAVTNPTIEHNFYLTGLVGTFTIIESKYNDVLQKGSINLADNNNYGLSIREDSKDYLNIDTLNDTMTLQNITDINGGSIVFNDQEIVVSKELVGSQDYMVPDETIVNLSNYGVLSGQTLVFTQDETSNITIPINPTFTIGDEFSMSIRIDKKNTTPTNFYIGVGEYTVKPVNYQQVPISVYTNTYYATQSGFGGSFAPPGIWSVNPNFSCPSYSTAQSHEIKITLDTDGKFNMTVNDVIKFSATLTGNTFEVFLFRPTFSGIIFDTSFASMLSDNGIIIDGYPVAKTFDKLLGLDTDGVSVFNQVNTQGIIIGDEQGLPDPTSDNSLRFGQGGGVIDSEVLDLSTNTRLRFSQSGVGEVMAIDHSLSQLNMENYHIKSNQIDISSYVQVITPLSFTWSSTSSNMTLSTNTFDQINTFTIAWAYSDPITPYYSDYDIDFLFTLVSGSRHYLALISNDEVFNNTSRLWTDSMEIAISAFGSNKFLIIRQGGIQTDAIDLGAGDYPNNTLVTYKIRNRVAKIYVDGTEVITNVVFTCNNTLHRFAILDTNTNTGDITGTVALSSINPDITNKSTAVNIYKGHHIQFEEDLKIKHLGTDDYIQFDGTNGEIDVYRNINSTSDISCNALTVSSALMQIGTTTTMLSISPYQGQLFFNTTEYNKLCIYSGSSWQAIGSTYQAINAGSATLIKGQPCQITVNADGVTQIIGILGSVVCNGLVCFENVVEGGIVTVATDGVWDFRCDPGSYVTGQYLHTNTTGNWTFTANAGLEVFGVIMETKTLGAVGYVRGLLHTRPR